MCFFNLEMEKRQCSPELADPAGNQKRARTSSKSPKPEEAKLKEGFSELWAMKPAQYSLYVEDVWQRYREQDPTSCERVGLYRGPVPDVCTVIPDLAKQTNRFQMYFRLALGGGQDEIPEDGVAWFFNDDNKVLREDADGKRWPENRIKVLDALDALIAVKPLTPQKKESWELFFDNEFYFSPDQSSFYTEYLDFICNPSKTRVN